MIASVQPSMDASSNSRARRRCCLVVGIWASGTWVLLTKSPRNQSASLLAQSSIYLGPALSTKCNANSLAASNFRFAKATEAASVDVIDLIFRSEGTRAGNREHDGA